MAWFWIFKAARFPSATASPGREHDAESGLIYFHARAYDPALGQFLQRDPIGFAAGAT